MRMRFGLSDVIPGVFLSSVSMVDLPGSCFPHWQACLGFDGSGPRLGTASWR